MKIRQGFVTNSSSSSFIIAVKEKDSKLSKDIEDKLLEWAKNQIFEKGTTRISSIEELDKFFISNYGYRNQSLQELLEDDYYKEKYDAMKINIEKGFVIYEKYISCEGQDEHLEMYDDALELLSNSKDFKGINTDLSY